MGPARHLALLPETAQERITWPVPFADGLPLLHGLKGRRVAVLASGDPFWFGAGSVITRGLARGDWQAFPGPSCFSLMAARLGLPLEQAQIVALHAAPFDTLRPYIGNAPVLLMTLRDGDAVGALAAYLQSLGLRHETLVIFEHLGGPQERVREMRVDAVRGDFAHPVCAALLQGSQSALPLTPGLGDDLFDHDGQITKSPIRALTLSALAPREGELLWDIGGGSGSISIEWCLAGRQTRAICIERHPDRAARIRRNADRFGVAARLTVLEADVANGLPDTPPQAIFIGGGLSADLLKQIEALHPPHRLVINAVTLESEALLIAAHARLGGSLTRIDIAHPAPIGTRTGWKASYPLVQWSLTR